MNGESGTFSANFNQKGVTFDQQSHKWGVSLRGYGYGGKLLEAAAVMPHAGVNRVEYRRGGLTEWYLNGPLGVEQGFTLDRAPGLANGAPLTLAFELSGALTPSVEPDRRGLMLKKNGVAALRYSGLTAWDARGHELPSWMELAGGQLLLRVDDAAAQYPLTIDPYVQAVMLTTKKPCYYGGVCDDGKAYGYFGGAVAMSADGGTVVVGASGEAYVFLRPSVAQGGWNSTTPIYYAAKLMPSDSGSATTYFGRSVAMTPDAGTIVVGDPEFYTPGKVYVFVRPANGWSSSTPLVQTAKLTSWWRATDNQLGASVTISSDGNIIAAGAPTMTSTRTAEGGVYVYLKPSNGWINSTENNTLTLPFEDTRNYSYLGASVSISADGNTLVAGSPYTGGTSGIGAAYVFRSMNNWGTPQRDAKLISSDNNYALFGRQVRISADGNTIAVSASGCRSFECGYASPGTVTGVYVYVKPGSTWQSSAPRTENAKLTSSSPHMYQFVGAGLAISADGSTVVATAPAYDWTGIPPSVRVFVRPAGGWTSATETLTFTPAEISYALSTNSDGTAMVIGAPWVTVGTNERQGVAYVFTGTPAAPIASVSPASLAFGAQAIGTTSSARTVTVTNSGSSPLHVTGVAATGPFTSTQNCAFSSPIAPGTSCAETVTFSPPSTGIKTGTLTFTDDSGGATGATQQVQLQGEGVKASTSTAITNLTPTSPLVGQPVSIAYSVTTPPGNSLTPSGTVTVQASTGESCTGSAPAGSCVLTFSTAADRTVTATYSGDASFSPSASAPLLVHVVNFTLAVSPSSQTVTGRKATYTVTVTPANGFAGAVSLNCSGGPANTACEMSPTSVSLSGAAATSKATFTVPNNAASGTYTVTFTGQFGGITRPATASLAVR